MTIPLPTRAHRDDVVAWLRRWLEAPGMQALTEACGWPRSGLGDLIERSAAWDFRAGAERHRLSLGPAVVDGRVLDEALIAAAAAELGLVGGMSTSGDFTHLVVLGGMVSACRNRVRLARELVDRLDVGNVAVLTAHRLIEGNEPAQAVDAGWGHLSVESEAAIAAARDGFDLALRPDHDDTHDVTGQDPGELGRRSSWFVRRWDRPRRVEVVAAPSGDPQHRRAGTVDQLRFWADRAGLVPSDRLVLVTTEHYVPYQQLLALRVLGVDRGCEVATVGTAWNPPGPYRGMGYLQEVRSTLLAARELIEDLPVPDLPAGGRPPA